MSLGENALFFIVKLSKEYKSDLINLGLISHINVHPSTLFTVEGIENRANYYGNISNGGRLLTIKLQTSSKVAPNVIVLTQQQLTYLGLNEGSRVAVSSIPEGYLQNLRARRVIFKCYSPKFEETGSAYDIETDVKLGNELQQKVGKKLCYQVINKGQTIFLTHESKKLMVVVDEIQKISVLGEREQEQVVQVGFITPQSIITVNKFNQFELFRPGVNPDELGPILERRSVIGMEYVFKDFLDEFKFKFLPFDLQRKLGLEQYRGILLHGPRGIGKTFAAQVLCSSIILCVPPKLVNGHGLSTSPTRDADIQSVFEAPKQDFEKYGSASPLHVIIIDDLDIAGELNGIRSLPNLLLIATINNTDLIGSALLRSVFETRIPIDFPDIRERLEILGSRIRLFRECGLISEDLNIRRIASLTTGFSRVDLHSLCSRVFKNMLVNVRFDKLSNWDETVEGIDVGTNDFEEAIEEIRARVV